ncbi:MAG: 3-isopropylmalate dehydratase small subunit, partial [Anaerolineales bacterium]|nr:3-isopropylmalate dehydratase small subunit [Anaerolineales bacterium]
MQTFHTLKSLVIPLPNNDVDTDQIIPARYLKVTDKKGLAEGLFAGWRYLSSGEADPSFPLNNPQYRDAKILLAGNNFGCGSSREHAPWALVQWGIRAVISTSFADIFHSNALKNGLLPIEVSTTVHRDLFEFLNSDPTFEVTIDLPSQNLIFSNGFQTEFSIDPFSKNCLVEGIDSLGYLLKHQ